MEAVAQSVRVRDINVNVVRVGRGSTLVICGGPQLGHAYLRALDSISGRHEVIYYDARGSGRTDLGDPSQLSFAGAVDDLEGLRAALGIERFTILGHSLGGHSAYLYASRHASVVDSLILVDTGPPLEDAMATELWQAMQALRTAADDTDLRRIAGSPRFKAREPVAVENYILNIYAPFFRDRATIGTINLGFTEITAANVVDYEDRLVATLAAEGPVDRLAGISCPTLVVHGEVDPIPVEFSRWLADQIPGARLAVIPGASHFPFIEDADAFLKPVREFLTTA